MEKEEYTIKFQQFDKFGSAKSPIKTVIVPDYWSFCNDHKEDSGLLEIYSIKNFKDEEIYL